MAKTTKEQDRRWAPSQVVAHNLTRARELRGLTQTQVAERLSRFTGARWSQATVAQAEGSVGGHRVRQFTANELVALARAFDLPILFFFLPPDDGEGAMAVDDAPAGLPWEHLVMLAFGHEANFPVLADRAAAWSPVLGQGLDIPASDALPSDDPARDELTGVLRRREPLLPEDVLAAVFHGLAARRVRGALRPGDEMATFVENLRGLADALTAFNNYRPGTFVDEQVVRGLAAERQRRTRRRSTSRGGE